MSLLGNFIEEEEEEEDSVEDNEPLLETNRNPKRQVVTISGHGDIANSFLVLNGDRSIIVDCGSSTMVERIVKALKDHKLKKTDVSLIVLTHTHYDHTKGLKELKLKHLKKAKIVVHQHEAECLEKGYSKIPPGTGISTKIASFFGSTILSFHFCRFPKIKPDIIFRGRELTLNTEEYHYFPGKLLFTPGHSKGSLCLIVGKVCIAGDTIESDGYSCFPTFCSDIPKMLRSWKILLGERITVLLPSHGVRCPIKVFKREYDKYSKKYLFKM